MNASDVFFISPTVALHKLGKAATIACGMIILRNVCAYVSPHVYPASSCPLFIVSNAERNTSERIAAMLNENTKNA